MKYPKYTILAGLLFGLSTLPAVAATVDEVTTTHNTTGTAQVLAVDGSTIQVNGMLNANDLDVYAIDVQATDVLTFNIDCGMNCGMPVDTKLTLFDSADMSVIWQQNDDGPFDPTTGTSSDPLIQDVSLGHAGTVYVLVSHWDTTITSDSSGNVTAAFGESAGTPGDYQLIITGATVPPASGSSGSGGSGSGGGDVPPAAEVPTNDAGDQVVNININPFYNGRWPRINPKSRGMLPVAILSQNGFNPADIVLESLRFGATGQEDSLIRCQRLHRDLNRDGVEDLLCFFSMRKGEFDPSSEAAVLTGTLEDGTSFTGQAPLKMVPFKRRHHGPNIFGRNHRR